MQFPVTQLPRGRVASGYNGMPSNCPNDELPVGKESPVQATTRIRQRYDTDETTEITTRHGKTWQDMARFTATLIHMICT